MNAGKIVVVLPTYNERDSLPRLVGDLMELGLADLEILVIDDGSPDGTGELADRLAERSPGRVHVLHRARKLGLGTAYRDAFAWALARGAALIVEMDADLSHSPAYLRGMIERTREFAVVVGSRYVPGGGIDPRWETWRRCLSRVGNAYARWVTGVAVRDVTAGFKVFRREVVEHLGRRDIRSDGYAFQIEVAHACQQAGYPVCEVPIVFAERVLGNSKMGVAIVLEALWRVWQIRFGRGPARRLRVETVRD